jgi:NTP pyrophosphatase (non-canonical NTP hydrolase)
MDLRVFQDRIREIDHSSGWDKLSGLQLIARLTEEMGELAQSVNRVYMDRDRETHLENIGVELADCLWVLVKLGNKYGIDLDARALKLVENAPRWSQSTADTHLENGLKNLRDELDAALEAE